MKEQAIIHHKKEEVEDHFDVFELQAELGITKHLGGMDATDALIEYCHINTESHVLDAGCGVGITPVYLAQQCGCTVVGVDIRNSMIAQARKRAEHEHMSDLVEFQVADVQALPFEDNQFDVVISESVLAMLEDKAQALAEYVRVTRPGGYIGLNEAIWVQPPTPKLLRFVAYAGPQTRLLHDAAMRELLHASDLEIVQAQTHEITAREEALTQIRRIGWWHILKGWAQALCMYFTRPGYRRMIQEGLGTPKELAGYMGYGLYVGRKPR